jgi:hypothetical protein
MLGGLTWSWRYDACHHAAAPHLSRATVVAEKLQAIGTLGQVNSRMKDFYDLAVLARLFDFDGPSLSRPLKNPPLDAAERT